MSLNLKDDIENNEIIFFQEIAKQSKLCFDRKVQPMGLTRSQWRVLNILRRRPGISQAKLAEIIEVEPMTLCRLLDRMEKNGWIARKPDPRDRRANCVILTDKVKPLAGKLKNYSLSLRHEFLKDINEKDYETMLDCLMKIKGNISEILSGK